MIKNLTPAQVEQLPAYRDKWIGIGLDTAPLNKKAVCTAIADCYAVVGKPAPRFTIFLDSPFSVCLAIAILRLQGKR